MCACLSLLGQKPDFRNKSTCANIPDLCESHGQPPDRPTWPWLWHAPPQSRGHQPEPASNKEPDTSIGTLESPPGQQQDSMRASDMRVTGILTLVTISLVVGADKGHRRKIPVIASNRLLTGPIQDGAAAAGQLISDIGM